MLTSLMYTFGDFVGPISSFVSFMSGSVLETGDGVLPLAKGDA